MSDKVVETVGVELVPAPGDALVTLPAAKGDANARLVAGYLAQQASPRSRATAADALRRLTRLVARLTGLDPKMALTPQRFDWVGLEYEQVMLLRAMLADQTQQNEISPGTANLTLSHLRSLIATGAVMKLMTPEQAMLSNPKVLKNIRGFRKTRGRALLPSEEQAIRAAAGLMGGYLPAMLDAAIVLAIGGGLRRDEIANLPLANVGADEIKVVGKGNRERTVDLDDAMRRPLERWLLERAELAPVHGMVFCSPEQPDRPLSGWSLWSLVRRMAHMAFGARKACEESCRCLVIVTGPHDFRRTFATRLLDMGFDLREVQKLMGHGHITTTAIYDKRDETALHDKRRKVMIATQDAADITDPGVLLEALK